MRSRPLALSLIVIALAAGGGWWWKSKAASTAATSEAAAAAGKQSGLQSVGTITALLQDVPVTVEASGTVAALKLVDLRAQTTSTVKEVLIKDGQSLQSGQLLFRFDDRADRANVEKARAQVVRDRATLADLERQFQRAQDLRAQNFVAQSAVDSARANLDAQQALLQADNAALQAAQVALSYNEIRSPLSGRAGLINVVAGSLVQANATTLPLVSIAQINPIAVTFTLPETQLAPLLRATRSAQDGSQPKALAAQVLLPAERSATKGQALPPTLGKVSFVDNLVDSSTGTIKVKAEFDNSSQTLWPGQYVRVRLQLDTIKDAVVIPQAAIILRGTERSVYVVGPDSKVALKVIKVRYPFGEMAVVDGIEAGARVVVDGKQNLRPGNAVREQAAALNPAAAAASAAASTSSASAAASGVAR